MKKQSISIVLLATILLQSCVAYQKTSVSLEEAANRGKVKLIHTDGTFLLFKNIEMQDSIYYGFINNIQRPLVESNFSGIYLQDKKKSEIQTVIFVPTFLLALGFGFALLFGGLLNAVADSI